MTQSVPSYPAGQNLRSDVQGPYARTDILSTPDLYPEQGQYWSPNLPTKITNSTRVSEDSPFMKQPFRPPFVYHSEEEKELTESLNTLVKSSGNPKLKSMRPDAGPPGTRRIRNKAALDAVFRDRNQQVLLKERVKLARQRDDKYWSGIEQKETEQNNDWNTSHQSSKRENQSRLAETYKEHFLLQEARKEEEELLEAEADKRIKAVQDQEDERERQKILRKKKLNEQINEEQKHQNHELAQRRLKAAEAEAEEEKRIHIQNWENEQKLQERVAYEKRRRAEKQRIQDQLNAISAKKLEEEKTRELKREEISGSELSKYEEEQQNKMMEKREQANLERSRAYGKSVRNHAVTGYDLKDYSFLNDTAGEDKERDFDAKMKRAERERTLRYQEAQTQLEIQRRKEEEKRLKEPTNMFFFGEDTY